MKKSVLALAALVFMAWGCSKDEEVSNSASTPAEQSSTPASSEISMGTDARPVWASPNYNLYEQTMTVEVQLQDALVKYASNQDLVSATINKEVRGLAKPLQVDGQWLFPLTVGSNEAGATVNLSYYCDKLQRIFTIQWTTFDSSKAPTGTGDFYKPLFVK